MIVDSHMHVWDRSVSSYDWITEDLAPLTEVHTPARNAAALDACGIDMILSGHLHVTHTGHSAERLNVGGHATLIVQAGTATSTRARGEMNSFNVVRISRQRAEVEQRVWDPAARTFQASARQVFEHSAQGWRRPHGSRGVRGAPGESAARTRASSA